MVNKGAEWLQYFQFNCRDKHKKMERPQTCKIKLCAKWKLFLFFSFLLQMLIEQLERERNAMADTIAEKMREHQHLLQVKMDLGMEVAAYRWLMVYSFQYWVNTVS